MCVLEGRWEGARVAQRAAGRGWRVALSHHSPGLHVDMALSGFSNDLVWEKPVVDIIAPQDARAWFKLRRVLRDTGLRFNVSVTSSLARDGGTLVPGLASRLLTLPCRLSPLQLRLQVFVTVVLVLLTFMLVMSFASVFSGGGLTSQLEPHILLTLQLTVFNVRLRARAGVRRVACHPHCCILPPLRAQLLVVVPAVLLMIGLGDYANEYTQMQVAALVEREMELSEVRRRAVQYPSPSPSHRSPCKRHAHFVVRRQVELSLRASMREGSSSVNPACWQPKIDRIHESLTTMAQLRRGLKVCSPASG